jgi:hypothetical protein
MAGKLTAETCGNCFTGTRAASSNYGVDSDGKVGMYVEEKDRAYTSSSPSNDHRAVTIEVADDTNTAPWHSSDKAMAKLVLLCADICRRNSIEKLNYTGDTTGNMTLHKWFKATDCPGSYLEGLMGTIASEVNSLLASGATTYEWNGTAAGSEISASTVSTDGTTGTLQVDITQFSPYVITVDPSVTKIDYDKLKELQVCGMMFKAGHLFSKSTHKEVAYRNTNLAKQVKACNEAELRFALYSIVRSRTVDEAKKECNQLYYTISKYPPGMGVWLKLDFPKSQKKTRNHEILDLYLERFEDWGLSQGCGLYCTKDELDLIDWDKYQDKFLLWYENMFTSDNQYDQVSQLITPQFFQVNPHLDGEITEV